jgi:hypothetical protein
VDNAEDLRRQYEAMRRAEDNKLVAPLRRRIAELEEQVRVFADSAQGIRQNLELYMDSPVEKSGYVAAAYEDVCAIVRKDFKPESKSVGDVLQDMSDRSKIVPK